MKLFGRKKDKSDEKVYDYEIYGGFMIIKKPDGYEISWKSPHITTINVHSMPKISEDVETKQEDDKIHVLTPACKLKLIMKKEGTEAYISKL